MRNGCWQRLCNDPFEKKSGQKPPGSIIQPDDPADMETASAVVPGTEIVFPQQTSAEIFHGEDHCHIEQTAFQTADTQFRKEPFKGHEQAGGAVDGKHPQGSVTGEAKIPAPQGMQGREQDLHAPAAQPTENKIFTEGFQKVFHGLSI